VQRAGVRVAIGTTLLARALWFIAAGFAAVPAGLLFVLAGSRLVSGLLLVAAAVAVVIGVVLGRLSQPALLVAGGIVVGLFGTAPLFVGFLPGWTMFGGTSAVLAFVALTVTSQARVKGEVARTEAQA
jgi:hypothetical protein